MVVYDGRLRLDRRVEASGLKTEGSQSSCCMAMVGDDSQTDLARRQPSQMPNWPAARPRPTITHHLHAVSNPQQPFPQASPFALACQDSSHDRAADPKS